MRTGGLRMGNDRQLIRLFAHNILLTIRRAAETGDIQFLEQLELTDEELACVQSLSKVKESQLLNLIDLKGTFINLSFNRDRLLKVADYSHRMVTTEELVDQLIRSGAPNKLFMDCYGLTSDEIALRRKELDVKRPTKPVQLSTDEVSQVYEALRTYQEETSAFQVPEAALFIHKQTGLKISRFYGEIADD